MMAQDWVKMTVGDVAQVKGGKRLPAGFAVQDEPTSHPYIRVTDMRDGGVDESDIKYVPAAAERAIRAYRIRANDIFISVAGTLGIVGRIPPRLDGANLTENADRLTDIKCDVDYLAQYLRSTPIQNEIKSISTVGAQPKLALGRIKTFEVLVPKDRAEQSRIARALGDVDDLIESLSRLLAKKQAIKQGMMQGLLRGTIRIADYQGSWSLKKVKELGMVVTGGTPSTAHASFWGGEIPWITPTDIISGRRYPIPARRITNEGLSQIRQVEAGSVLVTCIASIGKNALLSRGGGCNQQINAVTPLRGVCDGVFLYYLMELESARLKALAGTTATPIVSKKAFCEFELRLPEDVKEQRAIARVLEDADDEIDALKARLTKSLAIKQGMMQELLTGRTRLAPVEAAS